MKISQNFLSFRSIVCQKVGVVPIEKEELLNKALKII